MEEKLEEEEEREGRWEDVKEDKIMIYKEEKEKVVK
jgi:hypothetical protein